MRFGIHGLIMKIDFFDALSVNVVCYLMGHVGFVANLIITYSKSFKAESWSMKIAVYSLFSQCLQLTFFV